MSKINSITKQKAREAFDSLFMKLYDYEERYYKESNNIKYTHPEDMDIEDLKESTYKSLRILDKYFNPNYWEDYDAEDKPNS